MRWHIPLLLGALLQLPPETALSEEASAVSHGPIELRDQHPLSLLHTTFRPQDASILAIGSARLGANLSLSNTLNYKADGFRVDTETRVSDLFLRYGLVPGLEIQISQNVIWRGSGESDEFIAAFHKAFQFEQAKSELVPEDEYKIGGVNNDGTTFQLDRDGFGLSGLETSIKYSPSDQTAEERWAVLFGVALPTGTSEFGQDGLDLQLAFYGQAGFGDLDFYSGAALIYYTDTEINNLEFPSFQYAGFLGVRAPINPEFALYLGGHLASILLDDVNGYPDYQTYVDLGVRTRVTNRLVLDTALRENVLHSQGTTDITLMIGLTYSLGDEGQVIKTT